MLDFIKFCLVLAMVVIVAVIVLSLVFGPQTFGVNLNQVADVKSPVTAEGLQLFGKVLGFLK